VGSMLRRPVPPLPSTAFGECARSSMSSSNELERCRVATTAELLLLAASADGEATAVVVVLAEVCTTVTARHLLRCQAKLLPRWLGAVAVAVGVGSAACGVDGKSTAQPLVGVRVDEGHVFSCRRDGVVVPRGGGPRSGSPAPGQRAPLRCRKGCEGCEVAHPLLSERRPR
jgi:hypothetical protein